MPLARSFSPKIQPWATFEFDANSHDTVPLLVKCGAARVVFLNPVNIEQSPGYQRTRRYGLTNDRGRCVTL